MSRRQPASPVALDSSSRLLWPGREDAFALADAEPRGTLHPALPREVGNVFIEGDNLDALKLLEASFGPAVKAIYIDPPYNTGSPLLYRDRFRHDDGGDRHAGWLSMMLPRLVVARRLLRLDGLLLVSIDDHEHHRLRLLLDELFGEEQFLGTFVWQAKRGGGSDNAGLVQDHEYVLCYARDRNRVKLGRAPVEPDPLDRCDERGPWRRGRELNKWGASSRREDRPTMYFAVPGPSGEPVFPIRNDGSEGRWRFGRQKLLAIIARGDAEFVPRGDGTFIVYEKIRGDAPRQKPFRTWLDDVGSTAEGSREVRDLFGGRRVFDFAKPVRLLRRLVALAAPAPGDLVLDFFAGSGTTAHAVLDQSREDGIDRRFICIQSAEEVRPGSVAMQAGFRTIAQICRERIRRVQGDAEVHHCTLRTS